MAASTRDELDFNDLEVRGYLVRLGDVQTVRDRMLGIGKQLGPRISVVDLEASGAAEPLPVHTECVYMSRPIRYFLLGCVRPADEGGETNIYDARVAAQIILREHPKLAEARIEYGTGSHPDVVTRPLVVKQPAAARGTPILLFRDHGPSNRIISLPSDWDEDSLYSYVRVILQRSKIVSHRWQEGDVLIVNNSATLHNREPFRGLRKMIRMRIDEPARDEG